MRQAPVLLTMCAGVLLAAPGAAHADPTSVRAAYLELRDGGCKVSDIGSPIVARALRNVPYAMNGKIFKSPELTYLFQRDGGWYTGSDADADIKSEDRACVRALDAQEKALRKRVKLKAPIEAAITRHPGAVLDMARVVLADFKKFSQAQKTRDGVRSWTIHFEAGGGAALVTVECRLPEVEAKAKAPDWSKLDCNVIAAG
ncbi:MAG: YARHG domain-containing protein [Kofleriaceae bacterium]|nr:YARHG domain-containing protein [Kofleriaceae bacterium]MCL4227592.1 YARHG domain-containing protein [Myxococcales bacterium]